MSETQGRWEVRTEVLRNFSSYCESEYVCEHRVVDTTTGEIVLRFGYSSDGNSDGFTSSGTTKVVISDCGTYAISTHVSGSVEHHPLPPAQ